MTTSHHDRAGCPAVDFTFIAPPAGPLDFFTQIDDLRATATPAVRTAEAGGYWILTDAQAIREGLLRPELFSSQVITPTDPNPAFKWLPVMLDPPEHTKWRTVLAGYFSPSRIRGMATDQRRFANELIDAVQASGECDYIASFGQHFPASIFLQIMGMPEEHLGQFMEWEHMILHPEPNSPNPDALRIAGMGAVVKYFSGLIAERRANPNPDAHDIVSDALNWVIDGESVPDADLLNCLLLLFMAGLDTVTGQLSYIFHHLATHPEDRSRIVADPSLIPHAVEELLRIYPIVQTSRKLTQDVDFHGCPMKAGDMAMFPLAAAGRDEAAFADALTLDFDRADTRHHISFGAGPHRCLGAHLARQELIIAIEEWHRRIPDYEITGTPTEHKGGVYGIDNLRLRWKGGGQ
ncbi:MAG: cytochrome P450 [Mycobacterium sp.]